MTDTKLATIDDALIQRVRDQIVEACEPRAIYLFGSAARGDDRPGSDLDLLVVMDLPDDTSSYEKASELHSLFRGWRVPLDIIVRTPEQFERGQHLPGFVERTGGVDGIQLYRRASHD